MSLDQQFLTIVKNKISNSQFQEIERAIKNNQRLYACAEIGKLVAKGEIQLTPEEDKILKQLWMENY